MRPGVSGLPELGAVVGAIAAGGIMLLRQSTFVRRLKANGNVSIPEWRMIEAMPGAVLLAGGLFWMGWSGCRDEVHWIVPLVGGGITGLGIALVFLQSFNYLIDSYMMVSIP
jgi:DHA1 family multidrug resistance protein-like MFS transporter